MVGGFQFSFYAKLFWGANQAIKQPTNNNAGDENECEWWWWLYVQHNNNFLFATQTDIVQL